MDRQCTGKFLRNTVIRCFISNHLCMCRLFASTRSLAYHQTPRVERGWVSRGWVACPFLFGSILLRHRANVTVQQIVWKDSALVIPLFSLSPSLSRGASHQSGGQPAGGRLSGTRHGAPSGRRSGLVRSLSSLLIRPLRVFTACGLLDYYIVWPSLLYIYIYIYIYII